MFEIDGLAEKIADDIIRQDKDVAGSKPYSSDDMTGQVRIGMTDTI